MAPHDDLRERAFAANQAIDRAGLVILTFGNVSVVDREAGVVAIKPSGVPYEALTPGDVVIVELGSGRVVAGDKRPSSDTATHLVLYQGFGEVGGIVHTHAPASTAWAQAGRDLPCLGTTHADHFRGPVPLTRDLAADELTDRYEQRTGEVIIETFSERGIDPLETPAVLVASHGPFVWGPTVETAVENAVALEAVASLALDTLRLSPDIAPVGAPLRDRHFARKHGPSAYYGQPR